MKSCAQKLSELTLKSKYCVRKVISNTQAVSAGKVAAY